MHNTHRRVQTELGRGQVETETDKRRGQGQDKTGGADRDVSCFNTILPSRIQSPRSECLLVPLCNLQWGLGRGRKWRQLLPFNDISSGSFPW
jgi:hypothetical protein